ANARRGRRLLGPGGLPPGRVEMAPRLAPELRRERRLGKRDTALEVLGIAGGEGGGALHPRERRLAGEERGVGGRQERVRRAAPRRLDRLGRRAVPSGALQQQGRACRRGREIGREILRPAGELQRLRRLTRRLGIEAALIEQRRAVAPSR